MESAVRGVKFRRTTRPLGPLPPPVDQTAQLLPRGELLVPLGTGHDPMQTLEQWEVITLKNLATARANSVLTSVTSPFTFFLGLAPVAVRSIRAAHC
ncbi:hypothetical protein ACFX2G_022085 [Malus domestica]